MAKRKRKTIRISGASRRLVAFLQAAERTLPTLAQRHHVSWMWSVIFGISALAAAAYLSVETVNFTGEFGVPGLIPLGHMVTKQVGYFAALNWSVYSIGIAPVLAWASLCTWRNMPDVLKLFCDNRMIRDDQFEVVAYERVERSWRRRLRSARAMLAVVAILGVVFVMADWWQTVATPLLHPHVLAGRPLTSPESEYDWSISALYKGSHTSVLALLIFTFVVYAGIPLVSTLLTLETVIAVFIFVTFLAPWEEQGRGWKIVAVPQEEGERRCGWEVVSEFYTHLLTFALVVLAGLWLIITQNVYLRDYSYKNIFDFILRIAPSSEKVEVSLGDLPKLPEIFSSWAFGEQGIFSPGKKVEVGAYLIGLVAYGSVALSVVLLGSAARRSKEHALENIRKISHEVHETEHNTQERLELMQFWPVAWISRWPLLIVMAFFALSTIYYRLIVVIAVVVFIILTPRLIEFITEAFAELLRLSFRSDKKKKRKAGVRP